MPILKESGPQWLVGMAEYISDNLEFIVNGFQHSGTAGWLADKSLSPMMNHQNDASTEDFSDLSDEDHTDLPRITLTCKSKSVRGTRANEGSVQSSRGEHNLPPDLAANQESGLMANSDSISGTTAIIMGREQTITSKAGNPG